ncbi:hypothetical protein L7D48_05530 [Streptomyces sp. S1A]|uniref:hypothetical protein n=1 Tax=Streptomyces sp. ICN903 TaxID=2964654 RepID=UPI001EDB9C58|nr:hypothetical protein [Streptomyces sp. ICN903]MCG3040033.1 hypothetical protein [Streptomyces sp. ICN903]
MTRDLIAQAAGLTTAASLARWQHLVPPTASAGPRLPLAAGLMAYGLGGGAGLVTDSLPALLASRLVLGAGAAAVFTCSTAALLGLYREESRDKVMGWRTAAELKQRWRTLQHVTLSPSRVGDIARAPLVLNGIWN